MKVIRFLITIIWLIMVPIAVYMVVTAVMGLIGADEMTVSNGIMDGNFALFQHGRRQLPAVFQV